MNEASSQLTADLADARLRTLDLVDDLSDEQMSAPQLAIVNLPLWEIGHVAWFQEKWTLRHLAHLAPIRADADRLYDSAEVFHDRRWELDLPTRDETVRYMRAVIDALLARLARKIPDARETYFAKLVTFHEDMHGEAFVHTRQTLGYPMPRVTVPVAAHALSNREYVVSFISGAAVHVDAGPLPGDVEVPACTFALGAERDAPFVFDNEKWSHPVAVPRFEIARAPVTQAEFAAFVESGGYLRDEHWSRAGLQWRNEYKAHHPIHWRRDSGGRWYRRAYDTYIPLEEHRPVLHVSWYEADAYCRWAKRRLPTEAEWELAASGEPAAFQGARITHKRSYPWGDAPPTPELAHLDLRSTECADVAAYPQSDSAFGCRQMIGNVWEWTSSDFRPYPGFVIDPYKEYSAPWFDTHKVLRGGCFATRSRLIRNTWRNFYTPDRRDVLAGFRTVAL